jgi:hypothetical protein
MFKKRDTKILLENWRRFLNGEVFEDKKVNEIYQTVYAGGGGYVTTQTDIPRNDYLIYDDYSMILGRGMNESAGGEIQMQALTKKFVKENGSPELDIVDFFYEVIESSFGRSSGEQRKKELELIKQRAEFYKTVFSPSMYTDEKTIIFLPLAHFGDRDSTTESQRPYIKKDTSGKHVDFDISNEELSGKKDFKQIEMDNVSDNFGKESVHEYLTLKDNINWSMHDLGHAMIESVFDNDSIIDFEEHHPQEKDSHEAFDFIFKDLSARGKREIDSLENDVKRSDALHIKELLNALTPGVGEGDLEFSLFAKLIKNPTDKGVQELVDLITKNIRNNLNQIHPKIIKRFNIDSEISSGLSTLKKFLEKVLHVHKEVGNRVHDVFKIIYVPKN